MSHNTGNCISIVVVSLLVMVPIASTQSDTAKGEYTLNQNQQCEPDREFIKNNSIYKCNSEGTDSYLLVECSSDEEADRNSQGEPECVDIEDEERDSTSVSPLVMLASKGIPVRGIAILSIFGIIAGSSYWLGKRKNTE